MSDCLISLYRRGGQGCRHDSLVHYPKGDLISLIIRALNHDADWMLDLHPATWKSVRCGDRSVSYLANTV